MERINPNKHISRQYNEEIEELRDKVLSMGGYVEQQVSDGLQALLEMNMELAQKVATEDYKINAMEVDIDEACTQMIALRQPTASDLRFVVTIIKTISDLERIGDQAEKLGRYSLSLSELGHSEDVLIGIGNLGERVKSMLRDTLDAFARLDADVAVRTALKDKKINQEYDGVMRQLITHMMEDPRSIKRSLQAQWCARAHERIANHACNVCEYIVYIVSGRNIRHTKLEQVVDEFLSEKSNNDAEGDG